MSEGPFDFFPLEEPKLDFEDKGKIVPKRVGVVVDALDTYFKNFAINVPTVELSSIHEHSIEKADDEEVLEMLLHFFNEIQALEPNELNGSVAQQVQAYVDTHVMFVPFLEKARVLKAKHEAEQEEKE